VISASADSVADLAALTLSASRSMSPTAAAASIAGGGGLPLVTSVDVTVDPANAIMPPRPASAATPASAQDSPGVSYHAGISLDNQWPSAQNDNSAAAAASAVYNSSYFGAHQAVPAFGQRPQRPLHDIVSSMQGSFHFLQESQIELESMCLLYS